ncbi:DUF4347 domain-containing protein, partial [Cellvibrio sp. OA-2007]|uniref:DUF4347 domain-containing protein n=6 Tax=unclassified Cellvibrio TaxID=2624793 RepID=UPI000A76875C
MPTKRRPLIEPLEPRLLFSATADAAVFEYGDFDGYNLVQAAESLDLISVYFPTEPVLVGALDSFDDVYSTSSATTATSTTVIFVDTSVDNYSTLVADIYSRYDANSVELLYLDQAVGGVEQITEYLSHFSNVSSIHLISHAVAGNLQLGGQLLNERNLEEHKTQISSWRSALTADADILLYGCTLGADTSGENFLQRLHQLTGADIAASDNLTGNSRAGADWVLERQIGTIETNSLFSPDTVLAWSGVLADITYIDTGEPADPSLNSDTLTAFQMGQSFSYPSGISVDQISLMLSYNSAQGGAQTVTVQLLDAWGGNVLAMGTFVIAPTDADFGFQWVNFVLDNEVLLTGGNTYVFAVSSDAGVGDNAVRASIFDPGTYADGTYIINGIDDAGGRDLAFRVTNLAVANSSPSISIPLTNYSATEQVAVNLHGTGITVADADGDSLTVTLAVNDAASKLTAVVGATGVSITSGNGSNNLIITGAAAQLNDFFSGGNGATLSYLADSDSPAANATLTLTVSDGSLSADDSAAIDITAVNDAPTVVNAIPDQNATEDAAFNFQFASNTFSDVDVGDTLTYSAQVAGGGAL